MRSLTVTMTFVTFFLISFGAFAGIIGSIDKDVQATADPIIDIIISQLDDVKMPKYADFDEKIKKEISTFNQNVTENLGNYQSRIYLGFLNQNDKTIVIYKATFEKTKNDILLTFVIDKDKEGLYQIMTQIYLEGRIQANFTIRVKESWFKS